MLKHNLHVCRVRNSLLTPRTIYARSGGDCRPCRRRDAPQPPETIVKLLATGWNVAVVVFSDTIRFGGQGISNREGLQKATGPLLGVRELHLLAFADHQFEHGHYGHVLAQKHIDLDPARDLVVAHADTDLNLDHRLTADAEEVPGEASPQDPLASSPVKAQRPGSRNGGSGPQGFFVDRN